MPVIQTATLTPDTPLPSSVSHQVYGALDAALTLEVHSELHRLRNRPPPIYDFERALQAPYLEIMNRGFPIDELSRHLACQELRTRRDNLQNLLNKLAIAVWDRPLNPRSYLQLADFFYGAMKLPEVWIRQKGVSKLSTNREALEKLDVYLHARPFISLILGIRDISKQLDVFETEIDSDGRFRSSYNIAGTETGRPSSSQSAMGTGCVLPNTEVLTRNGWKPISKVTEEDEIAQWEAGEISFIPANIYKTNGSGLVYTICGQQIQLTMTELHTVIYSTWKNANLQVAQAQQAANMNQIYIPLGGKLEGGKLNYHPFLSMLMADFSKEEYGWRGEFSRTRKIERFLVLAKEFGFKFSEQAARPGFRRFYVSGYTHWPKKWGNWILDLSPECAECLVEEARYWDANDRGSGFIFCTADKEQAEWFHTLVHLSGRAGTLYSKEQSEHSWSTTKMWFVNVKNRNYAQVMRKHWNSWKYEGDVFCPITQSGYWLVRHNGYISVTGNSNAQNIAPSLRYVFTAEQGMKLGQIDLEQVEARDVGWFCGVLFGDWTFLDACEGGDLHTNNCKVTWPELGWTGDKVKDRAIADQIFYRDFTHRDMMKRGGHLSNYYGTAWTMARSLKIPIEVAEEFQARYIKGRAQNVKHPIPITPAYPCIARFWQWIAQEIQTTHSLTTPFGRQRHFFGRPGDDTTLREAIAFLPQSTTADRMNLGLWRVWKYMPQIQLLAQTYDSITFQYDERDEDRIMEEALQLIQVNLEAPGRPRYVVPGEAKVGWNWGYQVTQANVDRARSAGRKVPRLNLDGLAKWKPGGDGRVRHIGLSRIMQ